MCLLKDGGSGLFYSVNIIWWTNSINLWAAVVRLVEQSPVNPRGSGSTPPSSSLTTCRGVLGQDNETL